MKNLLILLLPLLQLAAGNATAQTNHYALFQTAKTNIFLGEVFTVDLIVKAETAPNTPHLQHRAFHITAPQSVPTSQPGLYQLRFAFRAKEEGLHPLPARTITTVGGETLKTPPLDLQVKRPAPTDRMTLSTTFSTNRCYVGEPILMTTTWDSTYQLSALKAVDFYFPLLDDKRLSILTPFEPDLEQQKNTTGLPVHQTRILAKRSSYVTNQVQHQTLSFNKVVIPQQSGTHKLAPGTLLCAAEKEIPSQNKRAYRNAFQYPSYFDNTFFDQNLTDGNYTRIYTETEPAELIVKPLPAQGRPTIFSGLVGQYSLHVEAAPLKLRVNEPLTLTITITSSNFMENIVFPPLRYQPGLINHFDIPSERSLPERLPHGKRFTQTIRPLSADLTELPPLELNFFNPLTHHYEIARSEPIPLTLQPAAPLTTFGADGLQLQNRLRRVKDGIRQNEETPDMLTPRTPRLFGWAHPAVVLFILLAPPLLIGGWFLRTLYGEKQLHIRRTAKAARAYGVYRRNASALKQRNLKMKSEIYHELDHVLRAYLGDRLHQRPGALTFREVKTALQQAHAPEETLLHLKTLFETCEAYRFNLHVDEAGDAAAILQHAAQVVKAAERSLK